MDAVTSYENALYAHDGNMIVHVHFQFFNDNNFFKPLSYKPTRQPVRVHITNLTNMASN